MTQPTLTEPAPKAPSPGTTPGGHPTSTDRHVAGDNVPGLVAADVVAICLALFLGGAIAAIAQGTGFAWTLPLLSLPYAVVFLLVFACYGLYRRGSRRLVASMFADMSHLIHATIVASLLVLLAGKQAHQLIGLSLVSRLDATFTGILAVILTPLCRMTYRAWLRHRAVGISRILVIGQGLIATSVLLRMSKVGGATVIGCVDDKFDRMGHPLEGGLPLLGSLDDLPALIVAHQVDHVIVAFSPVTGARMADLLRELSDQVRISIVPRLFELLTVRSNVDELQGLTVIDVAPAALGWADRLAKRTVDIVVSTSFLLLLSPVMITIAIGIKVTSKGPVFFRQSRTGRYRREFKICKFRTMRVDAEDQRLAMTVENEVDGPLFKMKEDPRITRIGGFLRSTSLDELPQMINVLLGDMSLVGPRPFVTHESAQIGGWAAKRFEVRPGMTGLWQISGRNDLPFIDLCRLDYSYVASWSLWWDIRIIWHTPASVLRRQGAY